jgi:UDP-N-acetyl-D-mannosaminuronic acid dehydrogenase
VDTRKGIVDGVNRGKSHLSEPGLVKLVRRLVRTGKLRATTDLGGAVMDSGAVVISVQTPYEGGKADLSFLERASEQVASCIGKGSTVVVESTVPPGTCEDVLLPIFEAKGRRDGSDFYFAYCPERIAPGNSLREFINNDRIVGANSRASQDRAIGLLKSAVKGKLLRSDILTAETTKLVENTARDVYIAFANDLAKMSAQIGVDAREVIELANTHPRVKILSPGPGVGGPCLTKDPYLLLEGLGSGTSAAGQMVRTARAVNDRMGEEVLALLEKDGGLRQGSKIVVLGTAYKPEVDDPRSSPSGPIIRSLLQRGYQVRAHDPYCKEGFGAPMTASLVQATRGAECALLLVAHKEYRRLSPSELARKMARDPLIVDAAGVFGRKGAGQGGYRLRSLGDGRGARMSKS